MYKLLYFTEQDPLKVITFMKENYFVVLTGMGEQYPVVTHLPLEIIEEGAHLKFTGHMMKKSDHYNSFLKNENVVVIFNGPHTHVSASWYVKKDVASTWNYMAVHAKGKIRFTDEADTFEVVKRLTNRYEPPESPSAFDKLPEEYVARLLKGIIAFEISVESFDNVFKLSQNHDPETRRSIATHLNQMDNEGARLIAKEMTERLDQ